MKIIEIIPTETMIAQAREMYTGRAFNQHTIDHHSQLVGHICELAFQEWLNAHFIEHDYIAKLKEPIDFKIGIRGVDVKGKRRTGTVNIMRDEAHVEQRIKNEQCDHYVFVSAAVPKGQDTPSVIELIGFLPRAMFWNHEALQPVKKGEETAPGFIEKADAGKLVLKYLKPMDLLLNKIQLHLYQLTFGEAE